MSGRERILTIRLLNKIAKQPAYARALGIENMQAKLDPGDLPKAEAVGSKHKL